jgi:hypothetical protein
MEQIEERYIQNIPFRPEYARALKALTPVLAHLPPAIVAIDGECNAGKTSLSRFLAYRFNITLVETDFYLKERTGVFEYESEEPKRLILSRLNKGRPVIVEGVEVRRLLKQIGIEPDFAIRVVCEQSVDEPKFEKLWRKYAKAYPDLDSNYLRLEIAEDLSFPT